MIYIGLDVHQTTTTIALYDAEADALLGKPWSVPTDRLGAELAGLADPKVAVMESGSVSHFATRQLQSCGIASITVHAAKASRRAEGMHLAKTDRLDAITLAKLMAWGLLNDATVWEPDDATHELRTSTRARHKLSQMNVTVRNMLRQFIGRSAQDCPWADLSGQAAGEWLDEFAAGLSDGAAEVFSVCRELLLFLKVLLARLEQKIGEKTAEDETVARLRTIPGVGKTLAPIIAAEIGDPERFDSAKSLRAYSGLVPKVSQSGNHTRIGRLTRQGNRHLRRALIQAAELFKKSRATKGLRITKWYWRQVSRHGPNPARVALARRLLTIIHAMLRDGTDFNPQRYDMPTTT